MTNERTGGELIAAVGADDRQFDIWRRMSPQQKFDVFNGLMETVREVKRAGVRARYPDWDEEMIEREVARLILHGSS